MSFVKITGIHELIFLLVLPIVLFCLEGIVFQAIFNIWLLINPAPAADSSGYFYFFTWFFVMLYRAIFNYPILVGLLAVHIVYCNIRKKNIYNFHILFYISFISFLLTMGIYLSDQYVADRFGMIIYMHIFPVLISIPAIAFIIKKTAIKKYLPGP